LGTIFLKIPILKKEEIIKLIESSAISVAASFPILSSIATGWNEYKNYVQTKNVEFILSCFYDQLKLMENKLDQEFLSSNEFKSIIVKTCFIAELENSDKKKRYLSYFLANACSEKHSRDKIHYIILETLGKVNEFDINILKFIDTKTGEVWENLENYDPKNFLWTATWEGEIIDNFTHHKELDIIGTLEYLNSVGVIENYSSRSINFFRDKEIKESLLWYKSNELIRKQSLLQQNGSFDSIKESNRIEEELEDMEVQRKESFQPEFEKNQYQKFYNISALGKKLLMYLEQ